MNSYIRLEKKRSKVRRFVVYKQKPKRHPRVDLDLAVSKELLRTTVLQHTVLDLGLLGQIVGRIDWRHHSFDSQESSQVGSVAGDNDQREEPPGFWLENC